MSLQNKKINQINIIIKINQSQLFIFCNTIKTNEINIIVININQ